MSKKWKYNPMILEDIEQKCLSYLKQVTRALVPFKRLSPCAYLRRQDELGPFDEQDLLDFLRKHELFQVIESPTGALGNDASSEAERSRLQCGAVRNPRDANSTGARTGGPVRRANRSTRGRASAGASGSRTERRRKASWRRDEHD